MLLRDVIGTARCERLVYVGHVPGIGNSGLKPCARSKASHRLETRGSPYRGGESREWLKTKCSEMGVFAVTGASELGEGRLYAVYVAEARESDLCRSGPVWLRCQRSLAGA